MLFTALCTDTAQFSTNQNTSCIHVVFCLPCQRFCFFFQSKVPDLKIIAVGIGNVFQDNDDKELEQIADGNKANVFKLNSFDDLVNRMKDIAKAFCQSRF